MFYCVLHKVLDAHSIFVKLLKYALGGLNVSCCVELIVRLYKEKWKKKTKHIFSINFYYVLDVRPRSETKTLMKDKSNITEKVNEEVFLGENTELAIKERSTDYYFHFELFWALILLLCKFVCSLISVTSNDFNLKLASSLTSCLSVKLYIPNFTKEQNASSN